MLRALLFAIWQHHINRLYSIRCFSYKKYNSVEPSRFYKNTEAKFSSIDWIVLVSYLSQSIANLFFICKMIVSILVICILENILESTERPTILARISSYYFKTVFKTLSLLRPVKTLCFFNK